MIRTVIVEDEFHPRMTLQQKLSEHHPDVEIIAACENAESALIEILRLKPDLVFLDIQLPEKNGIWLAEQLLEMACNTFTPPCVIFTTAYTDSEYLLKAFKIAAVDYLVKPVVIESLSEAIEKFRTKNNSAASLSLMMNAFEKEHVMKFRNCNGLILLHEEDIAYVKADGNYSETGLVNGNREEIFERLGEIERKLPARTFVRIGKSFIINRKFIRQINLKKSTVKIVTPQVTFDVTVPEKAIKMLSDGIM